MFVVSFGVQKSITFGKVEMTPIHRAMGHVVGVLCIVLCFVLCLHSQLPNIFSHIHYFFFLWGRGWSLAFWTTVFQRNCCAIYTCPAILTVDTLTTQ